MSSDTNIIGAPGAVLMPCFDTVFDPVIVRRCFFASHNTTRHGHATEEAYADSGVPNLIYQEVEANPQEVCLCRRQLFS